MFYFPGNSVCIFIETLVLLNTNVSLYLLKIIFSSHGSFVDFNQCLFLNLSLSPIYSSDSLTSFSLICMFVVIGSAIALPK